MRNRRWKSVRPSSLGEAFELCVEYAAEHRRPIKVLADLMGVEIKTLYRWLAETSMPLNRVRQFETFCGVAFISDYLCMAQGDKVVIAIPSGRQMSVSDLSEVQISAADAISQLVRFYSQQAEPEETLAILTKTLSEFAFHRQNVMKAIEPELELFGGRHESAQG